MPRLIEIAAGHKDVALPNGEVLDAGQRTVLDDEHWERLQRGGLPASITDLGAVTDPASDVPPSTNASAPSAVVVGTAAVELLAARPTRRGLLIQNVHASNDLYIGLGAAPTVANGIRVKAGESFSDQHFGGAVHGIASAIGTDVRVLEVY